MQGLYKLQRQLVPQAQTIIDCGASVGHTIAWYHSGYPNANIYAFEPGPSPWAVLCEGTNLQGLQYSRQLHLEHRALWSHSGEVEFRCGHPNSGTASVYYAQGWPNEEVIKVPCITLDEYADQQGLKHIDILKMDVQGGEREVLIGAQKLLEQKRIGLIVTEVLFTPLYAKGTRWWEYGQLLEALGYGLFAMDPAFVHPPGPPQDGLWIWGDAVFVPMDVIARHSPHPLDIQD